MMPPNYSYRNNNNGGVDGGGVESAVVYVCQSGTCRRKGSDAALVEIEELAALVAETERADVSVEATGCLGYCRRGPAVAVETTAAVASESVGLESIREDDDDDDDPYGRQRRQQNQQRKTKKKKKKKGRTRTQIYVGVSTLEKSATVVEGATGVKPPLDDLPSELERKLSLVRETKQREYLVKTHQWNKALHGILRSAREAAASAPAMTMMGGARGHRRIGGHGTTLDRRLRKELEGILGRAGYPDVTPGELLRRDAAPRLSVMPEKIEGYVRWTLKSVVVVTRHSAVFRFETKDPKRGTPHPRGRGRLPKPKTWHVTMLGERNDDPKDEGPLPWIERDYTPISSGLEWERGTCEILIKVYSDGRLTRWLADTTKASCDVQQPQHQPQTPPTGATSAGEGSVVLVPRGDTAIWLSRPVPTLSLPSLALDGDPGGDDGGGDRAPKSVLLLLAGTGIVALPQILAHREPAKMLGISTQRRNTLADCPIDLVHSCRADDLMMLREIRGYLEQGSAPQQQQQQQNPDPRRVRYRGLRSYTLLVSPGTSTTTPAPFDSAMPLDGGGDRPSPDDDDENDEVARCRREIGSVLGDLPNARFETGRRLDRAVVVDALRGMVRPCRVVVSGPDAYNDAARGFLEERDDDDDHLGLRVTVLSA